MSWLTEDPTLVLVLGGLAVAMFAIAFFKTGRVVILVWGLVVAGLVAAVLLVERVIVTEREEVEQTIESVRQAFLANDEAKVLTHISPEAKEVRRLVRWALGLIEVTEAKVTDGPQIEINSYTTPPSAVAELIGSVKGRARNNSVEQRAINTFTLRLSRQNERWLIEEVRREMPFGGNDPNE